MSKRDNGHAEHRKTAFFKTNSRIQCSIAQGRPQNFLQGGASAGGGGDGVEGRGLASNTGSFSFTAVTSPARLVNSSV